MNEQWAPEARRCVCCWGQGLGLRGHLVFIQLAVLILLLALGAEGDDDKAHKDVHHEEGNDDDVDDEEHRALHAVLIHGALVLCMRINGLVQQPREPAEAGEGLSQPPQTSPQTLYHRHPRISFLAPQRPLIPLI